MTTQNQDITSQNFEKFGRNFEMKIVYAIITDRVFCDRMSEVLNYKNFSLIHLKELVRIIYDYRQEYKTHPSFGTVETLIVAKSTHLPDAVQAAMKKFYKKLVAMKQKRISVEFEKEQAIEFSKFQKIVVAYKDGMELLNTGSYDSLVSMLTKAVTAGNEKLKVYDYHQDVEERFEEDSRETITTGWEVIDRHTKGGYGRGELAIVMAPSGAGKSMFMAYSAASALLAGYKVVYYTMELKSKVVANRIDAVVSEQSLNDITSRKEEVREKAKAKVVECLKEISGVLKIQKYPSRYATVNTLHSHIERLQTEEGFTPDLIVVDYPDLLKSSEEGGHTPAGLKAIYEDLRSLGETYDAAVLGCSQTNRGGVAKEVTSVSDVGDAYAKIHPTDLWLALGRTPENKVENTGTLNVSKNRNGPDGMVLPIMMDTSYVMIEVLEEVRDAEQIKSSLNSDIMNVLRKKR